MYTTPIGGIHAMEKYKESNKVFSCLEMFYLKKTEDIN